VAIVLLMAEREHSAAAARVLAALPNVTLLDRPASTRSVLSAVRAVLGARRRQYELRDGIAEQARAAQALREADARKDEFLAMLSHELRNPLAPLTNALRLIERREALSADGAAALAMAQRQTRQMQRLVDDLLEVSRVSRGKISLRLARCRWPPACATRSGRWRPTRRRAATACWSSRPDESLAVRADPARLAQILENLLGNAFKYTPDGGTVRVTCEAVDAAVGDAADGAVEIRVADSRGGHRPVRAAQALRALRADRHHHRAQPRRPGHRPGAGQAPGRAARRRRAGREPRPGAGVDLRAAPAAGPGALGPGARAAAAAAPPYLAARAFLTGCLSGSCPVSTRRVITHCCTIE
jgi:hypothetical protein